MQLPILYSKTNTGAIQFWQITTLNELNSDGSMFGLIETKFGQLNTESPQITVDIIKKGKNIGKVNETTPFEQAKIKAKQLWDKKIKDNYQEDLEAVKNGHSDLPSIDPMLAGKFPENKHKVKYPVLCQPKLDGLRCIAVFKDGKVKLYSRTRKEFTTVPHIVKELEENFRGMDDLILDGELYSHEFKEDFSEIISLIKRDEIHPDHTKIQYHIYDCPSNPFKTSDRMQLINSFFRKYESFYCKRVETVVANSEQEVEDNLNKFLSQGYEGVMIRTEGKYENKRSKSLLKYKVFHDDEFEIIGVKEGTGKLMCHAGSFVCKTKDGVVFNAKLKGKLDNLQEYFENIDKYIGKMLTVRYFGYTIDGSLRFPVGISVRDYE